MAIKNCGKKFIHTKKERKEKKNILKKYFRALWKNIFKFFIIAEFICDSSQIYLSLMNIYDKQKREDIKKVFFKSKKKGKEVQYSLNLTCPSYKKDCVLKNLELETYVYN